MGMYLHLSVTCVRDHWTSVKVTPCVLHLFTPSTPKSLAAISFARISFSKYVQCASSPDAILNRDGASNKFGRMVAFVGLTKPSTPGRHQKLRTKPDAASYLNQFSANKIFISFACC